MSLAEAFHGLQDVLGHAFAGRVDMPRREFLSEAGRPAGIDHQEDIALGRIHLR